MEVNDDIVEPDQQRPKKREFVSGREYDRYMLQHRGSDINDPHWLWSKGRLAETYMCDINARRERLEMDERRKNQQDLRLVLATDLLERFEQQLRGEHPDAKLGHVYFADPNLKGTRRYYQKKYANAMTIFNEVGSPSL